MQQRRLLSPELQARSVLLSSRSMKVTHLCKAAAGRKEGSNRAEGIAASAASSVQLDTRPQVSSFRSPTPEPVNSPQPQTQQPQNSPPPRSLPSLGAPKQNGSGPKPGFLRAEDAWEEFEARLEADLQTVLVTLVAIIGVICFWRGIWSLLDYYLGDNPAGDLSCILMGLGIILYIRLAGLKVGSFWPSG